MNSMDKNNSECKNSDLDVPDYNEEYEKKFPHHIGFPKDLIRHSNNFFNAALHCLTNIYDLTDQIIDVSAEKYPYIKLLNGIVKNVDKEKIRSYLENLKRHIIPNIDNENEKDGNHDPRKLISLLLRNLQNGNILPEFMLAKYDKICTICNIVTEIDESLDKVDIYKTYFKFDIQKILEYTHKKKIEVFTIYDCFQYYIDSIIKIEKSIECTQCHKETKQKIRINKLPDILFIFIYYSKINKNCYFDNSAYKFDENINFEKYNFLSGDDRKKKYFLYSLIVCKNVGTDFELYYTFSRKDENSKYIIYNGSDIRKDLNIKNKMEKDKIDLRDKKQSWPCVLVYKKIQE